MGRLRSADRGRSDDQAHAAPISLHDTAQVYGMPLQDIMRSSDHWRAFLNMHARMCYEFADAMLEVRAEPS